MIDIQRVSKRYGGKYAVRDASFTITQGGVLGFLGRNGAGKSTMMNMITGYISLSAGRITLDGYDLLAHPAECKRRIGYLPEIPPLYPDMTVSEYLRFCCEIRQLRPAAIARHVDELVELTGLGSVRGKLIRNLSKGYKQRTGLAQALVSSPEIVILDEPTVGLDPSQMIDMRQLIRRLGEEHTVVLSSHILSEVQDVCDRIVVINEGRIVAQDSLQALRGQTEGRLRLTLRTMAEPGRVLAALEGLDGLLACQAAGAAPDGAHEYTLTVRPDTAAREALFWRLAQGGVAALTLSAADVTLEEIFLRLTSGAEKEGADDESGMEA